MILALLEGVPGLCAEEEVSCAIHVHSAVSSGGQSITEIAKAAKREGVDAVIMTDLLAEKYEYGLRPFQNILKMTVKRQSILEKGAAAYLEKIREANEKVPEVLTLDGAAVTPFYYWSGHLWPGPLVLNHRGKDFLVLGLGDAKAYESLPVLGTGKSEFNAYDGDQFSVPYQKVIDWVSEKGGLVFWSHPGASEHDDFTKVFFNIPVRLDTENSEADLLSTSGYAGFGADSAAVRDIDTAASGGAPAPGGIWDRLLNEYCEGRRAKPSWFIGEIDYNGMQISSIGLLLNILRVQEKSREGIFEALKNGRLYVTYTDENARRFRLQEFSAGEPGAAERAFAGGEAGVAGAANIRLKIDFSDGSELPVHVLLVRDGKIVQEWNGQTPFEQEFQDPQPPSPKSYYRVIASSPGKASLISNPIFVRRMS